jgi:hypothetical protein
MSITKPEYVVLRAALAAYFPEVDYELNTTLVYQVEMRFFITPFGYPSPYRLEHYPQFDLWLAVEHENENTLVIWMKSEGKNADNDD